MDRAARVRGAQSAATVPVRIDASPPRSCTRVFGGRPLPDHLWGAVIALGNFDGFHLGHQAVVASAAEMARERRTAMIVGTFDPHPVRVFRPDAAPFRLTSLAQRERLFGAAGADAMMVFEFSRTLADVTPEEFVDVWLGGIGGIVTGDSFAFGRGRAGTVDLLAALGARRGVPCGRIGPVEAAGEVVSSTRIRTALRAGDCAEAARLLTRPYAVTGELRPGARMDPGLPLLDASIRLADYLRPRRGVYAVRARLPDGRTLGGSAYLAAAEDAGPEQLLELFLVDIREDDLGRPVSVEFVAHLHDAHETYDTIALRRRIVRDRSDAERIVTSSLHF